VLGLYTYSGAHSNIVRYVQSTCSSLTSCKRKRQVSTTCNLLHTYIPTRTNNNQLENERDHAENPISSLAILDPYLQRLNRCAAQVRRPRTYSPEFESEQAYDYSSALRASILPLQRVLGPHLISTDWYRTRPASRGTVFSPITYRSTLLLQWPLLTPPVYNIDRWDVNRYNPLSKIKPAQAHQQITLWS